LISSESRAKEFGEFNKKAARFAEAMQGASEQQFRGALKSSIKDRKIDPVRLNKISQKLAEKIGRLQQLCKLAMRGNISAALEMLSVANELLKTLLELLDCMEPVIELLAGENGGEKTPEELAKENGIGVKNSANISDLDSHITDKFGEISDVWSKNGAPDPVITSGNDSTHKDGSLHYENKATDLRANNVSDKLQDKLADDLQKRLGDDYDVGSEHFKDHPDRDHIHVEYDPKTKSK